MNLRDLRYVVAVAELGQFGRAASACNVSQPTLSGQILKLEEELGVQIFERDGRVARLTERGATIVAHARRVVGAADDLRAAAAASRDPTANELLEHVVKPAAGELVRRHPIATLAGAALAGAMLVRARPFSGLIGSVATAVLVRRLADAATHWIDTTTAAPGGPARVSSTGPTAAEREAVGPHPDAEP